MIAVKRCHCKPSDQLQSEKVVLRQKKTVLIQANLLSLPLWSVSLGERMSNLALHTSVVGS